MQNDGNHIKLEPNLERLKEYSKRKDDMCLGNKVLYDMCRKYPLHKVEDHLFSKIWLIGRSYAASIERRHTSKEQEGIDFSEIVIRKMMIIGSELDERIKSMKKLHKITKENLALIVGTHKFLTDIFLDITGQNKRSLASKYLHFHVPNMFYIYDSRANTAIQKYVKTPNEIKSSLMQKGDIGYVDFVSKLFVLQEHIKEKYGIEMTPRQLDSFLIF